jgi:hypothetical protein
MKLSLTVAFYFWWGRGRGRRGGGGGVLITMQQLQHPLFRSNWKKTLTETAKR